MCDGASVSESIPRDKGPGPPNRQDERPQLLDRKPFRVFPRRAGLRVLRHGEPAYGGAASSRGQPSGPQPGRSHPAVAPVIDPGTDLGQPDLRNPEVMSAKQQVG